MHRIIDGLSDSPIFLVRNIMDRCGTSRTTAQKDADALVRAGIVRLAGGVRPRTHCAPAIMRIAFADDPGQVYGGTAAAE